MEGVLKDVDIFLVDKVLNLRHDLKASDYYINNQEVGEFNDRFSIEFVAKDGLDALVETEDFFKVSNNYESLNVNSNKSVYDIKVYDLLGRVIIHGAPKEKSFQLNTSGVKIGTVMLIEALLEDGTVINRKSVKY